MFLGGLNTAQVKAEDDERDLVETPADIVGYAYVIHELVRATKELSDAGDAWFRIAVHRVSAARLKQSWLRRERRPGAGRTLESLVDLMFGARRDAATPPGLRPSG